MVVNGTSNAMTKKKKKTPEIKFHLNICSMKKDLPGAIAFYETAVAQNLRFNQQNFNTLLYLCSTSIDDLSLKETAISFGFRIFDHLKSVGFTPNEATITAVARLAAAKGDGDYAFELVKNMQMYDGQTRLRTYDPALLCFCENLEADKAYEVEQHMGSMGVSLEEPQFSALLKMSSETGKGDDVYAYLHKLRCSVDFVTESTAKAIEDWFRSDRASAVGEPNLDMGLIRETIIRNGGGWHGQGWIGKGNWEVKRTNIDSSGNCCSCDEQLVSVDIDCAEREKFSQSVASWAMERGAKSSFGDFQDWLEVHKDYDAIVDGANIGLYQQNFTDGGFSLFQLEAVVKELRNGSIGKWPLVILHNNRVCALLSNPSQRKLVEEWKAEGVLYTTPKGSNDDWYWLYAAVKLKCLLITNDEMRDHIFEFLGSSSFLKWKEKHQVHYTFVKGNLKLEMPPRYSLVIQESERGSWHVPIAAGDASELERTWLCVTRPDVSEKEATDTTRKRKERSPSPS